MPYKLRGKCVVRADTGAVVKCHPDEQRARKHLAALKMNVRESGPLGALLERFDPGEARGPHGRWIKVLRGLTTGQGASVGGESIRKTEIGFYTKGGTGDFLGTTPERAAIALGQRTGVPADERAIFGGVTAGRRGKPPPPLPERLRAPDLGRPVAPRDVNPSRHPTPTPGLPPDAAGLMRARARADRAAAEPVAKAALAKGQRPVGGASVMAAAAKAQATHAEILAKSPNAQRELDEYHSVQTAAAERHGGFSVGDQVSYRTPSIVNGKIEGYGPRQYGKLRGFSATGICGCASRCTGRRWTCITRRRRGYRTWIRRRRRRR